MIAITTQVASHEELIQSGLLVVGKGARIEPGVSFRYSGDPGARRPICIGPVCQILPGVLINEGVEIGGSCIIDSHASIGAGAKVGQRCHIGSSVVLGETVVLGDDNTIHSGSNVIGQVEIGARNTIGPFAAIGTPPQHRHMPETPGVVRIGNDNVLREFITVHMPTLGETRIGSNCYMMAYNHVPHDAEISDDVTLANSCQIGGHTRILKSANLGLSCVLHQYTTIGSGAMIAMGSIVVKDVPPYVLFMAGVATRVNHVGLERMGRTREEIAALEEWYATLYRPSANAADVLVDEGQWWRQDMVEFFRLSRRNRCKYEGDK